MGGARAQGPLGGIDQTSYMAEVWALYKVMRSIAGVEGEIWVIIDNQSVQREADKWRTGTRKGVGNCPGIWWKIRDFILKCPGIRFGCVPSHDKKQEEWEALEGHNTMEWRALNDEAKEASVARDERWLSVSGMRNSWVWAERRASASLERMYRGG